MSRVLPTIIPLLLTNLILMYPALKFGWSKKFWSLINRRVKPPYNAFLFGSIVIALNILIQIIFELLGLTYSDITNGILLGVIFLFFPSTSSNVGTKK